LLLELEPADSRLRRRGRVEVEWVDPDGLARARGRITEISSTTRPRVQVELTGDPVLVQRREHMRARADLAVGAWSVVEPTRRFTGTTINLSGGGALAKIANLPLAASLLELQIALPDRPLLATARILRRQDHDLVALAWERIAADAEQRLIEFVQQQLMAPSNGHAHHRTDMTPLAIVGRVLRAPVPSGRQRAG
jgi:hypothetical protein